MYLNKTIQSIDWKYSSRYGIIKNICNNIEKYLKTIDLYSVKKTVSIKNIINEFK